MKHFKNLTRWGKLGCLIFIIINVSFVFLLLSPLIPNLIGEYRDNQLLAGCNERIQQYRMGSVQIKLQFANETPIQGWNVSFNQIRHEFIFGCNIYAFDSFFGAQYTGYNESYKAYFKQLFNFAVLPFYWTAYEPEQGTFPTEAWINTTLQWCIENNITTKGHPLAWTRSYGKPTWLPLDNDTLMAELLQTRINTIVAKYRGQIDIWDVVNEPIHTESFAHMSTLEYVLRCLQWANSSNPNGSFTVNDYGIMGHDFGNGPFYNLLNDLNSLNAPFNFIGMQCHEPRTDWIPATEIWKTLEGYSRLGKKIHITEFTPISAPVPITNSWHKGMWSEAAQAEYALRVYTVCFSHPAMGGIIWWDLCDLMSWLEEGGLLRSDMTPKPVYTALDQLINHEWHTSGSQLSNASGCLDYRGFYGLYNVSIQNGAYQFQINVKSGANNQFVLTIY